MRNSIKSLIFLFAIFSQSLSLIAQQNQYWQQEVNYKINVTLDDVTNYLNGDIQIDYKNNSPSELSFIYFHLWPNGYSNNDTDLAKQILNRRGPRKLFEIDSIRGYIDSLDFKTEDNILKWEYLPEHIDICKVFLNSPLKSGESITISTPFRVKIPAGDISRLGQAGGSYAITQWYPKPAVYDEDGWHEMPYLDMGEFYSEFGSFDVNITVPKNYVVAATGNLQNKEEIQWLDSLANLTSKIDSFERKDPKIESSKKFKTLHYTEKNIHDFGWFANKNFNVLKSEVTLPRTNKIVTTWAFFPNREAYLWKNACEYINDALSYYSKWNGDYPYNNCSAVHGPLGAGGGMEYPTITVVGNTGSAFSLEEVIMHEVGHNWFYGMLGFNERDFPFLDEGINSTNEFRYTITKYPESKLSNGTLGVSNSIANFLEIEDLPNYYMYSSAYLINARRNYDQPSNLHSTAYTNFNYGLIYYKPAAAFNYLREYLGDETYDKTFQNFFDEWHYKHPSPDDLNKTLQENSKFDLSWFTNDILTTTKKMDYKLARIKGNEVLVKNSGDIASPFPLQGIKDSTEVFEIWQEGFTGEKWITLPEQDFDKVVIDKDQITLDVYKQNNSIKSKGLFTKVEPVRPKLLLGFDNYDKTEIYFSPIIGWNNYNKTMVGATFHNISIFKKRFEYLLSPMYGFGNKDLAGSGQLFFHFPVKSGAFRNVDFEVAGKQYGALNNNSYNKLSGKLTFEIRESLTNNNEFRVNLKMTHANTLGGSPDDYAQFYQLEFNKKSISKFTPLNLNLLTEFGPDFSKLQLEGSLVKHYIKRKYALNIDFFAGKFLTHNTNSGIYNFSLSGKTDYLYEHSMLARFHTPNDEWYTNQFINSEGGFASLSYPIVMSSDWMVALKISHELPFNLRPYFNIAALPSNENIFHQSVFYEGGIRFGIKDAFEVYFPLIYTHELEKETYEDISQLKNRIRFVLDLNKVNPINLLKKIPY